MLDFLGHNASIYENILLIIRSKYAVFGAYNIYICVCVYLFIFFTIDFSVKSSSLFLFLFFND